METILVNRAKKGYSVERLFDILVSNGVCASIEVKRFFFWREYLILAKYRYVHITAVHYWLSLWLPPGCNVTMTIHDTGWLRSYKGVMYLYYYIFWFLLPMLRCSRIVAISNQTRLEIIALLPQILQDLIDSKITIIHNHCPTPSTKNFKKKKKRTVLQIGAKANKNRRILLEALGNSDKYDLLLVGFGNEALPSNASLFDSLTDDELLELYDEAEYLFFVSYYEGFGLPVLESLSRFTIPVVSNISVFTELFGGYVYQISITDLDRLSYHFDRIDNDKLLKSILLHRGRQLLEKFSVDQFLSNYIAVWS